MRNRGDRDHGSCIAIANCVKRIEQTFSKKIQRIVSLSFLIMYVIVIIYITCLCRTPSFSSRIAPYPLWSYVKVLTGNWNLEIQIIENIILFIPLGFLGFQLFHNRKIVLIFGLFLSISVEVSQLIFCLGLFEVDDILNNTMGAFIGTLICNYLKISDLKKMVGISVVVLCSIIFCLQMPKVVEDILERTFFFQLENKYIENGRLMLNGYCFVYQKPGEEYSLLLKTNKETTLISTDINQPSDKINSYFKCEEDYSKTGFSASADRTQLPGK